MVAQCPSFQGSSTTFAEDGTDRHSALRLYYHGDDSELVLLDDESQQAVRWAADYIRAHTTDSYPVEWEIKRQWTRPDFSEAEGTPDVVNGRTIFDFKWRHRDYTAQMADYAYSLCADGVVTVHLLFGATRKPEVLQFDAEACEKIINPILENAESPHPKPCDYCGWCAKRLICPALTKPATIVADGYQEPGLLDLATWRPSEMMDNPEHLAFALTLWRKVLKKWGESVEFHAMEAATKRGLQLPGYELKSKSGRQFVSDVAAAFAASGLSADEFLKACEVRLNTSKKYPDRLGLDQLFKAKLEEKSIASAKRKVVQKLGDLIQRTKDTLTLSATKGGDHDDDNE